MRRDANFKWAVRRLPDRLFSFVVGGMFLLGVLRKCGVWLWFFYGEVVVECVVNVVSRCALLASNEWDMILNFIFSGSCG